MINELKHSFHKIFLQHCVATTIDILLTKAKKEHGNGFQINGAIKAAKLLKINPAVFAQQIIDSAIRTIPHIIDVENIKVSPNGFINFNLNPQYLVNHLLSTHTKIVNHLLKKPPAPNNQTVVIDYSSPNIAKEMHVGHLRSTVIGDAISRIFEYAGFKVIRQNHIGDFGPPVVMAASYFNNLTTLNKPNIEIRDLDTMYRLAKEEYDNSKEFKQLVDKRVGLLHNAIDSQSDETTIELINHFREISMQHCNNIYFLLGVKLWHRHGDQGVTRGESFYHKYIPQIMKPFSINDTNNMIRKSEGALCAFFDKDELPPLIIQKSDGSYLYSTTDLATIWYRAQELHADLVLYVVDSRQSLHFKQIFTLSKQMKLYDPNLTYPVHVAFGMMMNKNGKPFKTREGGTVKLLELLTEAIEAAKKLVTSKHNDWAIEQVHVLAQKLAIGAIKYADLSRQRTLDYLFDIENMLSFDGNTAPYIMYAYTRIKSLLLKASKETNDYHLNITNSDEYIILQHIAMFDDVIEKITLDYSPHHLCSYLYELATLFMKFYESHPILKAETTIIINNRLNICRLIADTIKTGLDLLGIEVSEQM
jgi:arginyl-tRNA synthetase